MLCSVVTCYQELVNTVQCCYMLHCVVEFCAAVLNFVMCSCHAVQCCYMFHCVVEFCAAALCVVMGCCMMCGVVSCCQVLLHAVQCC